MSLPVNSRLGPYQIKAPLGWGGMGEVYRAQDSRLDRDVAIKVLHEEGATSPERRTRFEREARAIAALNHPNIVGVFDFGIEGGQQFIVSELVDGDSLRSRLSDAPFPVRRLVEIATQIADGLAAAHAAGIVHRDMKPENIMLAKDGRVKILDFGLARQVLRSPVAPRLTSAETAAGLPDNQHITAAGQVLGTPSYMSPEQAIGKDVDYRSDQFSFGLILYEMATGRQAFVRNSALETMAAIVRDDPAPIEQKLPAPLLWLIDRCLHKDAQQRYDSTLDLYRDLRTIRDHLSARYASSTINLRLAAVRRLAYEAADCGLLSPDLAAGIRRVKGPKKHGVRLGNWLTALQGKGLLSVFDRENLRGQRDYAMVAVLLGCGLRRAELAALDFRCLQQREDHWVFADLVGKGAHVRTVPVPTWVEEAIASWASHAKVNSGAIFRAINKAGRVADHGFSPKVIWGVVKKACAACGLAGVAPHDLRRTSARLCHEAGGELDQIQFSLVHVSVQTTERYIGCKQRLHNAVNDAIGIEPEQKR